MLAQFATVLALLLLSGMALAGALAISRRSRLDREERVKLVARPDAQAVEGVGAWLKQRSTGLTARMQRAFAVGNDAIWGMKSGAVSLIVTALLSAAAGWAATRILLGFPVWLSLLVAVALGFLIPRFRLIRQQRKVEREFSDLFPDAVDAISRMLRAGLPISSAVRSVSVDAPPPVDGVFAMVADQMSLGTPLDDALDASSRFIGLPDFRFFTVAVVLQHATGGNLAATLEILSDIVRKRRAVRLKAQATTAEIRVSAYVLGALPIFIVLMLAILQPGYLAPLFLDPRGHIILLVAAGLLLLAGISMRQMMRSVTNL